MTFLTSTYYTAPSTQVNSQTGAPHFSHDGVLYNIPYRDPVSTGAVFGDGNQNVLGEQKLVFETMPETFAVANILPTVAGIPRINPYSHENRFSRKDYTVRFNT